MSFTEHLHGDVAVLAVEGKLMGGEETDALHDRVKRLCDAGITKIVMDLNRVKWMNSSGLGALMSSLTTAKLHGGDLRLASVADKVENLLMITQLLKIFKSYPDRDQAVRSFQGSA